jgi:hypothetical protein
MVSAMDNSLSLREQRRWFAMQSKNTPSSIQAAHRSLAADDYKQELRAWKRQQRHRAASIDWRIRELRAALVSIRPTIGCTDHQAMVERLKDARSRGDALAGADTFAMHDTLMRDVGEGGVGLTTPAMNELLQDGPPGIRSSPATSIHLCDSDYTDSTVEGTDSETDDSSVAKDTDSQGHNE